MIISLETLDKDRLSIMPANRAYSALISETDKNLY